MSIHRTAQTSAFGVEANHPTYRLRQARYYELAADIARLATEQRRRTDQPLDLLDVGCDHGISMRYLEAHEGHEHVRYHGADLFPRGMKHMYKREQWQLNQVDLELGMPELASSRYDVVVCEQVLEHLHNCQEALAELVRVLRPGGLLIVGVPIFPLGAHLIRRHLVPQFDRWLSVKKVRGHVQAFSKSSFLSMFRDIGGVSVEQVRGFRFISGGPLRPLEYCRWWWQLNRRLGRLLPSFCTEIQVLARKQPLADCLPSADRRATTPRGESALSACGV